jgi:hypothetical protein
VPITSARSVAQIATSQSSHCATTERGRACAGRPAPGRAGDDAEAGGEHLQEHRHQPDSSTIQSSEYP